MGLRQARSSDIALIAGSCGFDAVYVDLEHSPLSLETTSTVCLGALGVIFPHVDPPEQAQAMVAACRYAPLGHRSVMGPPPSLGYRTLPADVANAEAIAVVPGIDMLLIGTNDLCAELGIPGEQRHPRIREAFAAAAAACKALGKALGIGGVRGDPELQKELYGMGGRFFIAGSDVTYLQSAARADAKALRGMAEKA